MKNLTFPLLFLILCLICNTGQLLGQHYTLLGGFIERNIFFKPASVLPNKLWLFEDVAPGFFDHPLQEAFLNPAYLGDTITTSNYFYVDYRTLPSIERRVSRLPAQEKTGETIPWYTGWPTPGTIIQSKVDEPRLTVAWIYRPASLENLAVGLTYRHIYASEPYYDEFRGPVPSGIRMTSDIPEVSLARKQRDGFLQTGYFPSIIAALQINDALTTGLRLSMSYFTGNGNLQDGRVLDDETGHIDRSLGQTYIHWEAAGGINLKLSDRRNFGIGAGILYGDLDQTFNVDHFIGSSVGERYEEGYWSQIRDNLSVSRRWNRDGFRYFGTVEMRHWFGEDKNNRLRIFYTLDHLSLILLDNGSGTNLRTHAYRSSDAPELYHINRSEMIILDGLHGEGTHSSWGHRGGVTRHLVYGENTELLFGLQIYRLTESIETTVGLKNVSNTDSEGITNGELTSTFYNRERRGTRVTGDINRVLEISIPLLLRFSLTQRLLGEGGFVLQYQDYTLRTQVEDTQHYYVIERPDEIHDFSQSVSSWERREYIDGTNAAILLGIGYRILPHITLRLTGITGVSNLNNNEGTPVPGALIVEKQEQNIGRARFMLGLEAEL